MLALSLPGYQKFQAHEIIRKKPLGQGSFSNVYIVELESTQIKVEKGSLYVAKVFKGASTPMKFK